MLFVRYISFGCQRATSNWVARTSQPPYQKQTRYTFNIMNKSFSKNTEQQLMEELGLNATRKPICK